LKVDVYGKAEEYFLVHKNAVHILISRIVDVDGVDIFGCLHRWYI
jgi:hypothetical protein